MDDWTLHHVLYYYVYVMLGEIFRKYTDYFSYKSDVTGLIIPVNLGNVEGKCWIYCWGKKKLPYF
jgi:hypothetical protein